MGEVGVRWQGQFAVGSRVRGTLYSWASRLHTRASAAAVYIQARTRPPAAAVPAAGDRAVLSRPREREPLPKLMFPKADIAAFQHPKRSTSTPPQTILLIGSSAHGMMRAAAGGPAVPSRSRPAQAGEEARGCVCVGGAGLGVRPAPGAPGPGGGGAPGSAAATAPPAAGALPEQRRSVARLGASSAGLLALLAFLLRGLLLLLPRPRRPLPQPAPPLPPCLPLLALSALTFPSPGQRRRAPRQPPAPLQTAGCERGCALYPVPAPRGRSGENRTMPGARDQGAARARWLGIGLLGKTDTRLGFFYLLPQPFPPPPPPRAGNT